MRRLRLWPAAAAVVLAACGGPSAAETAAGKSPTHVDRLVPRDEALRRFQAALPTVDSLTGGATSRDLLVKQYMMALEDRDTTGLRRMLLDRSEFAYLYYPTTPQGQPPYDLSPHLLWFLTTSSSDKGLGRAIERMGGRRLGFAGYTCDPAPSREGRNVVWGPCAVRVRGADGTSSSERLFGLIIERSGRFKFVSYANRL